MNMTSTPTGAPQTASPSTDSFHAEVLGPFQLDELIGEYNGFAVFSATHQQRQQSVTLYLVPAARGEAFPQFQAVIEAASKLEHPSIAKIVDFGEIGGIPYVAYENIDGISVQRLTKLERKISPPIACAIVRQAAIGLHHLHENGLTARCRESGEPADHQIRCREDHESWCFQPHRRAAATTRRNGKRKVRCPRADCVGGGTPFRHLRARLRIVLHAHGYAPRLLHPAI